VSNPRQADVVLANGRCRSEMKRGRIVKNVDKLRLRAGDHLSIRNPEDVSRWYEPGGFCDCRD
jgi:hypothetical protein